MCVRARKGTTWGECQFGMQNVLHVCLFHSQLVENVHATYMRAEAPEHQLWAHFTGDFFLFLFLFN